ncbi:MAG: Stage V sporulation protein E Required for spore cortex synthesi [Parcubacteria group bacterium Athens0714_24]|nr:MAG: Stage V sporulation protein E Required for spore cortex synthesi [Parcubacteria group bacterium Athens0714_24]
MKRERADNIFLGTVIILALAGFIILSSASMGLLSSSNGSYYKTLIQQFLFGIVGGGILLLITSHINYKMWQKFSLPFFIFTFLLTLLVFVPGIGFSHGGATRWINIGSFSFHPSELLKFGFVVYLCSWLASKKTQIKSFKSGLVPFLIMTALVAAVLIKEPDVGTLGVIAITSMIIFFIAGGKLSHIALIILFGALLLYILVLIEPYRMNRVITFFNPSFDPKGGMSVQKFNYLPEPIGDSIFSVFSEEFGFVGAVALLGILLFFLYRGFSIALKAPDDFSRLLGAGIVILIITESLVNIAAMLGILPLTGIPLIFVSKGGSAMAVALAEVGVLLNISKHRSNQ